MVNGQLKNSQTTKRLISQTTKQPNDQFPKQLNKKIYEKKTTFNFNHFAHSRFGRVGR
jgi:hypothetical protein